MTRSTVSVGRFRTLRGDGGAVAAEAETTAGTGAGEELSASIEAGVRPLRERGAEVIVAVATRRALDPESSALALRAVREILALLETRPVSLVIVAVVDRGPNTVLRIDHDRLPATTPEPETALSAGGALRGLGDALADRGGSLTHHSGERSDRFTATFPAG